MDRLFLDANVLFTAAHRPKGKAVSLFDPFAVGLWELSSSAYAIEEARRNLALKYPDAAGDLPRLLKAVRVVAQPPAATWVIDLPAKDLPIWAAAHADRATHLLTGDLRDFGPFMNSPALTDGMTIQTVADYLRSLTP